MIKKPLITLSHIAPLALLIIMGAIAGCTTQSPSTSPEPAPVESPATPPEPTDDAASPEPASTEWATLFPGDTTADLTFAETGDLLLAEQQLLDSIPVSYENDTPSSYAARLLVSPSSPSGRYSIVKACEDPAPGMGLCWSIYAIDREEAIAQKVGIGKYGGMDWVQWSPDERYAVFLEKMEGTSWFVVLDLEIGESLLMEELSAEADLSQLRWTGDRTFQVPLADGSTFEGDIQALFPGY